MEFTAKTAPVPLQKDLSGQIRISDTRITLETLVTAFKYGSSCEEIVFQYPSLDLSDVYAVIGYYLKNRGEVEAWFEKQGEDAKAIRHKIQSHFPFEGIRERLLNRRVKK
jgi:uncharacterized protein (DUF433 family)